MSIDASTLLDGLLQHNYFPALNKSKEEMPPVFSTTTFNTDVAQELSNLQPRPWNHYKGYDSIGYRLTRFNGVFRRCSIIHPKIYANLTLSLVNNWSELNHINTNTASKLRMRQHDDGRILIMNYEPKDEHLYMNSDDSFGKLYVAKTDISHFYPSFYSHTIPWGILGIELAKQNISTKAWYNDLDVAVRHCNRNESRGVAVGPATSWIVTETVLQRIDSELRSHFKYSRIIDDYKFYCDSESQAIDFLTTLGECLERYQLQINASKTVIEKLPLDESTWITDIGNALPDLPLTKTKIDRFFDFASHLAHRTPDGSVLKYALKSITSLLGREERQHQTAHTLLSRSLNAAFHQPALIPNLGTALDYESEFVEYNQRANELYQLLDLNVRFRRSDAVAWLLYFHYRHDLYVNEPMADAILSTGDCLPILMLYITGDMVIRNKVIDFAESLDRTDFHLTDQYWLLLYQLYLEGSILDPHPQFGVFETMASHDVNFQLPIEKCVYDI